MDGLPIYERWLVWALALGVGSALVFIVCTYGYALAITRGRFGWPGVRFLARETLWVIITQAILPYGWRGGPLVALGRAAGRLPASGSGGRPVVMVHGYSQNRTNFIWLRRFLARRGVGPFFGFNYQSFARVEKSAAALARSVEKVLALTGATHVDLVCHSLGGLVARTYVDMMGGHAFVRSVVTLGTPHRGLGHVSRRLGASVGDMNPRSGFIARLEGAPLPEQVTYLSIFSTHDNIVFPSTASHLSPRGSDVVVVGHGHFGILFSEEVAEHVHGVLVRESPAPLPETAGVTALSLGQS